MSVEIDPNIPGLAEASAELDRLMAAQEAAAGPSPAAAPTGESASEADRAGQGTTIESAPDQKPLATDTPAAAEPAATVTPPQPEPEPKPDEAKKSRYEKARERQEKSWAELNAQKEAFNAEREQFQRQRAEFEARRAESERQFSPEQYEAAAAAFERDGKLDLAELARIKAEDLRKHPPAQKIAREAEQLEGLRREWALKAGVDFPDLAKDNSPLQVRVAQLFAEEPDLKSHPKGIYLAARLASLEAEAAGVPGMKKELAQLKAKVKELEALTAPGGPGGAASLPAEKPFDQKSESEQLKELTDLALAMGPMR